MAMHRVLAYTFALCFVSACCAVIACAQVRTPIHPIAAEVHGQVRYATTKEPVDHAFVRLEAFGSSPAWPTRSMC
jgi:hypothetical protein